MKKVHENSPISFNARFFFYELKYNKGKSKK